MYQNRRQEVVNRGLYVCAGALHLRRRGLIFKFDKNSTDLYCFIFQFGGAWSFVRGAKPTRAPRGDGTELHRRLHAVNSRFVASLVVHCCAIKKNVIVASQLYDVANEGYSSK